jgi:hypothetical protein
MGVAVKYDLTGTGGSECFVEIGDQQAHLTASYLSDALGDLLHAVVALLRGGKEAGASFAEEPGEYRWRLRRRGSDQVSIRILWFEELWSQPDEKGKAVLDA